MAENPKKPARKLGYPNYAVLWLIWTLIGSLAYARHYLENQGTLTSEKMLFEFLVWLTCFYPWIALSPLAFRLEHSYPLGTPRWPANLGRLAAAGLPMAILGVAFMQVLYVLIRLLFREPIDFRDLEQAHVLLREFGIQFVLFWTAIGGGYVVRNLIQLQERERQTAKLALEKSQLETTLREAQIETLRVRLNPHFLFNCLQNIAVLTREDPQTASQMVTGLGVLLRAALRHHGTPETTVTSEIELAKYYIAVEKMRFADRLSVHFDVSVEAEMALLPVFLLQPLIENAIIHGLRGIERTGTISIRITIECAKLVLTVTDNGIGLPTGDTSGLEFGIGLNSTCERLEKMYPHQHSFSIRSLPEEGTEVRISIPLRFAGQREGVLANEQAALVAR